MSGRPYFYLLLICVFLSHVQHNPTQTNTKEKHTLTHKHSTLNVSVLLREAVITDTNTEKSCSLRVSGGPEESLRAPSTVYRYFIHSHSILSSFSLTLLCMTTTLWLSALSQVSMALQMLQILSRAGAWWSGQPKSSTWERRREVVAIHGNEKEKRRDLKPSGLPLG